VHSKTLPLHKRNNRPSNRMTYLLIITLATLPIPSQIPHTVFDIISLGVDAVLCHDQDTCKTVHTCARSKMPQHNIVNNVWLFTHDWFQDNSMCIDRRQSTQLCPYQMGICHESKIILEIISSQMKIKIKDRWQKRKLVSGKEEAQLNKSSHSDW